MSILVLAIALVSVPFLVNQLRVWRRFPETRRDGLGALACWLVLVLLGVVLRVTE